MRARVMALSVVLLLLSACAFPGGQLGPLKLSEVSRRGTLPPVTYGYSITPADTLLSTEVVERGLRQTGPAFARFELSPDGKPGYPYHLSFSFSNTRSGLKRAALISVSALTLTLVPVRLRDPITLEVSFSTNGRLVQSYRYDDWVDTWVQLVMIPVDSEHRRSWAIKRVVGHMLMHFLRDFQARPPYPQP